MAFQFLTPRNRDQATPGKTGGALELSLYKEHPAGELSLEEFEKYALDRLRVLKAIEEGKLRSKGEDVLQAEVKGLLKQYMQESSKQETARKDTTGHYILRLAYCRTADLRAWFLAQESELFKLRFKDLDQAKQVDFFRSVGLPYQPITEQEFAELKNDLAATAISIGDVEARNEINNGQRTVFYKVPFANVPDLIGNRRVLLRAGLAYVGQDQVSSLVVGTFRAQLASALMDLSRKWALFSAQEGGRLAPLVEAMPTRSFAVVDGRRLPKGQVTLSQLPSLVAGSHFPPCMTLMYERTVAEHHAKHFARNQLTLFLKAIGLSMEEAMAFWRQAFSPRTPAEKFNKEYAYDVRYAYGQEGSHKDWSEYSCVKIINQDTLNAKNDFCNGGCPYKQMNEDELRSLLARMKCSSRAANEAVEKAKGRHFQIACAIAFEGMHGVPCDAGINRPSEFYALSVQAAKQAAERQDTQSGAAATPGPAGMRAVPPTPASAMSVGSAGARQGAFATPKTAAPKFVQ